MVSPTDPSFGGGETFLQGVHLPLRGIARSSRACTRRVGAGSFLDPLPGGGAVDQTILKPETPRRSPQLKPWRCCMLDPLSGLTRWERWALETWLDSMEGRGPAEIKWSELPPVRYARALGQLAFDRGMKLPRRYVRTRESNPSRSSISKSRSVRATKPWEGK